MSEQSPWWERYKLVHAGASEIAAGVEAAVTAGRLAPGSALPPVRELAGHLRVNPNTVASAYRTLRDRGTVETRGRAGTRVRERPGTSDRMRPYELPAGVRDLTSGEPEPTLLPRLRPPATIDVSGYRYVPVEPELEEQLRLRVDRLFAAGAGVRAGSDGGGRRESGIGTGTGAGRSEAGVATDKTDKTDKANGAEVADKSDRTTAPGAGVGVDRSTGTGTDRLAARGAGAVDKSDHPTDADADRLAARGAGAVDKSDHPTDADAKSAAASAALFAEARILAVFGALDGIERLLATHTRPGDKIAVEDPAWSNMLDLAATRGLTLAPMRMDDEGPDPSDLHAALVAGVRAVVVTTRAQNPYGAIVSAERAAALRGVLAEHPDVLTIDDDHGADLTPGVAHLMCGATRQWAYLYSASKSYGPDLRIAAMIADADTAARVAGQLRHSSRRVPGVMQLLWAGALADRGNDEVLAHASSVYAEKRSALIEELAARGVSAHGASGLSVWVPVPDETAAATGLLARGWAVAPGRWFRVRSGQGVRITVASMYLEEIAALADAVADTLRGRHAGVGSESV